MSAYPPLPPPPGWTPQPEEVEQETRRPRTALVLLLTALVLTSTIVAVALWRRTPASDACGEHTIESARFGYCVAAPGWRIHDQQRAARLPYDELIRPADASTVRIVAIDLDPGQDLELVVQTVRSIESEGGIEVGEVVDRRVAGVPAAQWDIALGTDGSDPRHIREVVFVREDTAWRVQLLADAEGLDARLNEFDRILRSWIFR